MEVPASYAALVVELLSTMHGLQDHLPYGLLAYPRVFPVVLSNKTPFKHSCLEFLHRH